MSGIRSILVGVDLVRGDPSGSLGVDSSTASAITHAQWLAQECGGRLTFFSAFPRPGTKAEHPWRLPASRILAYDAASSDAASSDATSSDATSGDTAPDAARSALAEMVCRARKLGIVAGAVRAPGDAAVEIARQVARDQYDLVVVGTHDARGLRRPPCQ